jgi:formate hydrogenlyase subunit 4
MDASPLFWVVGLAAWVAKLAVLVSLLCAMEVSVAKMRVLRVPQFLGAAILLALLAVVFLFVSQGFA